MSRLRIVLAFFLLLSVGSEAAVRLDSALTAAVAPYFAHYVVPNYRPMHAARLERAEVCDSTATVRLYGNDTFGSQPFTPERVAQIYADLKRLLPAEWADYHLRVYGGGYPIEELVPNMLRARPDTTRLWGALDYKGPAWVENASRPFRIPQGLAGRHFVVWASHGRYYDNEQMAWAWQRPALYASREDLLTQTFVVPFLIPMLERAGAVVYSPRERDWQTHEVVVDNDTPNDSCGLYYETSPDAWQTTLFPGFARYRSVYLEGQNPFFDGTARSVKAAPAATKSCTWLPNIPATGRYAVYVSYQTYANSVSDAHYTVVHQGVETHFSVNQQMGGGTWVYLGTFCFDAGQSTRNLVRLSNESAQAGLITADAVRFGGGMGNVARSRQSDSLLLEPQVSGLPRYLEGARYAAQWAGMPYAVYSSKNGVNDYADDINARSYSLNELSGGSLFLPDSVGRRVPFELSLAVHTDAGYNRSPKQGYGTLAICTTQGNAGRTDYLNGRSRFASYDLAHGLADAVSADIRRAFGFNWPRREVYNRNYSETRNPEVPSAIVEVLAHQNFADMRLAHDPNFKFFVARSIYKAIARYVSFAHAQACTIAPLPVQEMAMTVDRKGTLHLTWEPTPDSLESSAMPTGYVVYIAQGDGDFDNGTWVRDNRFAMKLQVGRLYRFRVSAVNAGGESLAGETLVARFAGKDKPRLLMVNGFTRLSGPAYVSKSDSLGFCLDRDMGVPYGATPEYCGRQLGFNPLTIGREGAGTLGYSGNELEGQLVAGNSFNFTELHAQSLRSLPYTLLSCSRAAVEQGEVHLRDYDAVDLFFGLQRNDSTNLLPYKTFTPALQRAVSQFVTHGGRLLVSGAYIGSDLQTPAERAFAREVLHYSFGGTLPAAAGDTLQLVHGTPFVLTRTPSSTLAVQWPDCLTPEDGARAFVRYADGRIAATRYADSRTTIVLMAFPPACVPSVEVRKALLQEAFRL